MTRVELGVAAAVLVLLVLYLALRFNSLWIYRFFDHSLTNKRDCITPEYELPCYFRLDKHGKLATRARWPGWDGWYFFVIPSSGKSPIKMIRGSLMTGLYGLNGIDDYSMLPPGVGTFHAVEHLTLTPAEYHPDSTNHESRTKQNHLCHSFEAKPILRMDLKRLSVEISTESGDRPDSARRSGVICGKWPAYQFAFQDPDSEMEFDLTYKGKDLVWWADIPGVFTYFAAFGEITGTMKCKPSPQSQAEKGHSANGHPVKDRPAKSDAKPVTHHIHGYGAFEHGYARKPFNFDTLYLPVRAVQKFFPSFRPILYHYLLWVGDDDIRGGCMYARGFGIEFRNRGGLYVDGAYVEIQSIEIRYLESDEYQESDEAASRGSVKFPTRWTITARTSNGNLEMKMVRDWPPARIAKNMIYYNHSFEGTFQGKKISGSGYGEYLSI